MVLDLDPDALRVAKQRDDDRHVETSRPITLAWPRSGAGCVPPTPRRSTRSSMSWRRRCARMTRAPRGSVAQTPWAHSRHGDDRDGVPVRIRAVHRRRTAPYIIGGGDLTVLRRDGHRRRPTGTKPGVRARISAACRLPWCATSPRPPRSADRTPRRCSGRAAVPAIGGAGADFVRSRDLTCRWMGCDKPAWQGDIDHTVPYPPGPTHPSNNECLCRFHHLLKTFHCGRADGQ